MVTEHCSVHCKEILVRFCTNLRSIYRKSTVSILTKLEKMNRDICFRCICVNGMIISGRGGQSALRFARLRMEKRHNYVRKVAEVATQLYITNDKPNIAGLILAGSADFKTELSQSDMFDPVSNHTQTRFAR